MSIKSAHSASRRWSLKSLKFFEACARHETFAGAADELYVSHSAVSKQIKNLEQGLGFALFVRDAKIARLSPAGAVLASHLTDLFFDLDALIEDLASDKLNAPLVISCEPTICLKFLIPYFTEIEQQTGVNIQVLSAGGPLNFRRDPADIAIRRNDFELSDELHIFTIGQEYVGPVLDSQLKNTAAADGAKTTRIHSQTRSDAWLNWQEQTQCNAFNQDIYHQRHFLALEAAESGQGAALMSIHMVSRLLQQQKLYAPFGFVADGSKYLCLSARPFELDDRKLRICQWLRDKFSQNEQLAQAINAALCKA